MTNRPTGAPPWFDHKLGVAPPTQQVAAAESLRHAVQLPRDHLHVKVPPVPVMPSESITVDLGGGPPV